MAEPVIRKRSRSAPSLSGLGLDDVVRALSVQSRRRQSGKRFGTAIGDHESNGQAPIGVCICGQDMEMQPGLVAFTNGSDEDGNESRHHQPQGHGPERYKSVTVHRANAQLTDGGPAVTSEWADAPAGRPLGEAAGSAERLSLRLW